MANTGSAPVRGAKRSAESVWSMGMGRVSGIPIRLHFTFLVLLGWLAVSGPLTGLLFVVGVFICVVLHELGHSIVAQKYGIGVAEIVLYPIGGVARLEKLPEPKQEVWIALAGPAVNVVLAVILFAALIATHSPIPWGDFFGPGGGLLQRLLFANLMLCGFNLIPAFPMDGGRVLRAILAINLGELRGTEIAAAVGQVLAIILIFVALWQQMAFLVFIGVFVYLGAGQEANMYRGRALVEGVPVHKATITDFRMLSPGASLGEAAELLLKTSQQDFPVVNGDEAIGILTRNSLLRGLAEEGKTGYVTRWMDREFLTVSPDLDLASIAADMQSGQQTCALVMRDGELLGIVTLENLAELLLVRQATKDV